METFSNLKGCIEALAPLPVPVLRHSVDSYHDMPNSDDTTALTNLVLMDPGLIVTLLRYATELPRKHLQADIKTVTNAIIMLGNTPVRNIIESSPIVEDILAEPALTTYKQIVSRAYHSAYQSFALARSQSDLAPDEIFAATMLQEVGSLAMCLRYPKFIVQMDPAIPETQDAILGFTLQQLSQALVKRWQLSDFIQTTLDPEAQNQYRIKPINLGVRVGWITEKGWDGEEAEKLLSEIAIHLHSPPTLVLENIKDNAELAAEETPFYGVESAISKLSNNEKTKGSSVKSTNQAVAEHPTTKTNSLLPYPLLARQIRQLEIMVQRKVALPQLMSHAMLTLHKGCILNRTMFMTLNQERTILNTRFVTGSNSQAFKQHAIRMGQHHLFDVLLEEPKAIWLNDDNRMLFWSIIPPDFAKLIAVDSFFAMSICLKNKPIGVFYADRFGNDNDLDKETYDYFRQICQLTAEGLRNRR